MGAFDNYQNVLARVERCAKDCGRDPREVTLVAVSKTVGPEAILDAVRAGAHDFGENRIDVLTPKVDALPGQTWHFIGNIQSRKIPQIVAASSLIHSLYQVDHAEKINKAAASLGKVQEVLIEVNVSGEESKSGCTPAEAISLVHHCCCLENVRVRGLMTMAPQGDAQAAEKTFQGLSKLKEQIAESLDGADRAQFNELSMGMSEDWPQAIAAGATIVRIGRAIFSDTFVG